MADTFERALKRPRIKRTAGAGAVPVTVVLLAAMLGLAIQVAHAANDSWLSRAGKFRVSYTSKLQPIVINRIHSWVLHVETAAGETVENADISIDGGMPAHNHGLPTVPIMTRYLGDGDYLIEGMRFHMQGAWELYFTIHSGDLLDTVVIPLEL